MYAVTVTFVIKPGFEDAFGQAVTQQARNSLMLEEGCHLFEVCQTQEKSDTFFLYETYSDFRAFDEHCKSTHFKHFDQMTSPWVASKTAQGWERLYPQKILFKQGESI